MLIPFKTVYSLIERYYTPKSLMGIIDDCYESFNSSIATAEQIEDYRYLHQMVTQKEHNQKKYCFFWDYIHSLPTVLARNVDCTVDLLVKMSFDHKRTIPEKEFIQLIETVAHNLSVDSKPHIQRFNGLLVSRQKAYSLEHDKIQRNEPCPCQSGKKYKYCHGKPAVIEPKSAGTPKVKERKVDTPANVYIESQSDPAKTQAPR